MDATLVRRLDAYRPWFYAAAIYNLAWGLSVILWPAWLFDVLDLEEPSYLALWQVVGMFVLVFAPGYRWAARQPARHAHLIAIGMLGKILGPVGFAWAVLFSDFPLIFGLTILTNDLVWYPAFASFLWLASKRRVAGSAFLPVGDAERRLAYHQA